MLRIAVLLSGSGSNLQAVIEAINSGALAAQVVLVLADRPDAYGLQRALSQRLPCAFLPLERWRDPQLRSAWEQRLGDLVALFAPDLVLLSGFMRVLSPAFLARFPDQLINQHPALLPADSGPLVTTSSGSQIPALRGAHVVADALRLQLPVTGCTVHRVTAAVDDGPLLGVSEVPILAGDDEAGLHERIKQAERALLIQVLQQLAQKQAAFSADDASDGQQDA